MSIIPKFIRKLQPLKIIGKAVSAVVPGGAAVVSGVDAAIKAVKGAKVSGPAVISAAAQGAADAAKANIESQVAGNAINTTLKENAVPIALVIGGAILLVLIVRRR